MGKEVIGLSQKGEATKKDREPFTDVDGKPLKFCDLVEVLNGIGLPGQVIIGKLVQPGPWKSTVEYKDGGRIEQIENDKLKVRW